MLRGRELLLGAVDIERFERIDYFQRRVDIDSKGVHLERLAIGVVKRGDPRMQKIVEYIGVACDELKVPFVKGRTGATGLAAKLFLAKIEKRQFVYNSREFIHPGRHSHKPPLLSSLAAANSMPKFCRGEELSFSEDDCKVTRVTSGTGSANRIATWQAGGWQAVYKPQ